MSDEKFNAVIGTVLVLGATALSCKLISIYGMYQHMQQQQLQAQKQQLEAQSQAKECVRCPNACE